MQGLWAFAADMLLMGGSCDQYWSKGLMLTCPCRDCGCIPVL